MDSKIEKFTEAVTKELDEQLLSYYDYLAESKDERVKGMSYSDWLSGMSQQEFNDRVAEIFDHFSLTEIYERAGK